MEDCLLLLSSCQILNPCKAALKSCPWSSSRCLCRSWGCSPRRYSRTSGFSLNRRLRHTDRFVWRKKWSQADCPLPPEWSDLLDSQMVCLKNIGFIKWYQQHGNLIILRLSHFSQVRSKQKWTILKTFTWYCSGEPEDDNHCQRFHILWRKKTSTTQVYWNFLNGGFWVGSFI